jgi:hypothetical protein
VYFVQEQALGTTMTTGSRVEGSRRTTADMNQNGGTSTAATASSHREWSGSWPGPGRAWPWRPAGVELASGAPAGQGVVGNQPPHPELAKRAGITQPPAPPLPRFGGAFLSGTNCPSTPMILPRGVPQYPFGPAIERGFF